MNDLARGRIVGNRSKPKPTWVMNDKKMMSACVDKRSRLRYSIAEMYWRKNMMACDIATVLNVSLRSVESVIQRLYKVK